MLTIIIVAYIATVAIFLTCVAVSVTGGQRRTRIKARRLEGEIDAIVEWLQSGQKAGR
jgi:Flp pilus assembly protein TadB